MTCPFPEKWSIRTMPRFEGTLNSAREQKRFSFCRESVVPLLSPVNIADKRISNSFDGGGRAGVVFQIFTAVAGRRTSPVGISRSRFCHPWFRFFLLSIFP
jgi:hypothetical protein